MALQDVHISILKIWVKIQVTKQIYGDRILPMIIQKQKFAYAATILSLAGISFSAPIGALAIKSGGAPIIVGMYRMAFSIPITALVWFLSSRKKEGVAKKEITLKHNLINLLSGVFLAFHFTCWYYALGNTTVFSAAALVSLQPIFAMLGAYIIYKQKPARSIILPLFIALAGSYVLISPSVGEGLGGSLFGNIMAASGSLFMAAYLLCGKFAMKEISLGRYVTVTYTVCFLLMAVEAFIMGETFAVPTSVLLLCFLLSFSATLFGHTLINWSLPYVGAFFVTVVLLGEPIGASLAAFLMFGTVPGLVELLGGAMIIAGIAIMVMRANKNPQSKSLPS